MTMNGEIETRKRVQAAVDAAKSMLDDARSAYVLVEGTLKAAQQELAEAQADEQEAIAASDKAFEAHDGIDVATAQARVNEAQKVYEDAVATANAANDEVASAQNAVSDYKAAVESASQAFESAKENLSKAVAQKVAAKEALDEAIARENVARAAKQEAAAKMYVARDVLEQLGDDVDAAQVAYDAATVAKDAAKADFDAAYDACIRWRHCRFRGCEEPPSSQRRSTMISSKHPSFGRPWHFAGSDRFRAIERFSSAWVTNVVCIKRL